MLAVCIALPCAAQNLQQPPHSVLPDTSLQLAGQATTNCSSSALTPSEDAYEFNAGAFTATIVQVTVSTKGNYTIIRLNLLFTNKTDHPLLLAYHGHTSILADNYGNTYFGAKGGDGPDTSVTGMGIDTDTKTDPQFVLQTRQSDTATFAVWGHRDVRQDSPLFHYDVAIDELSSDNPRKISRQHVMYFGDFIPRSRNPVQVSRTPK